MGCLWELFILPIKLIFKLIWYLFLASMYVLVVLGIIIIDLIGKLLKTICLKINQKRMENNYRKSQTKSNINNKNEDRIIISSIDEVTPLHNDNNENDNNSLIKKLNDINSKFGKISNKFK